MSRQLRIAALERLLRAEGVDRPGLAERLMDAATDDRRGSLNPNSKLQAHQVKDIKERVGRGEAMRAVARHYNISDSHVARIVKDPTAWANIAPSVMATTTSDEASEPAYIEPAYSDPASDRTIDGT